MSIINEALKKTQQGMTRKTDETPAHPPTGAPPETGYIYSTPPAETAAPKVTAPYLSEENKENRKLPPSIKSALALLCALAITGGSVGYIYLQFQKDIPKIKKLAKTSFYTFIHKKEQPDFKTRAPEDLKPLAQLTIASPAHLNTAATPAPIVLNVHGVMANGHSNIVLINDQVYQEGDEVQGAKILKINLDSILVTNNGKEETIRVGK